MDLLVIFLFSMAAFFTLAMVAWFIIQQVLNDRKKEKVDLEKNRKQMEQNNINQPLQMVRRKWQRYYMGQKCSRCSKAAVVIKDKIYYCADCEIERIAIRDPSIKLRVQRFGLDMPKRVSRPIKGNRNRD